MWDAQQVVTMRPDARTSQQTPSQAAGTEDSATYRLPQAPWPSVPPHARVGRGSQPPRPIERPPSLRVIRDAPWTPPEPPAPRRNRRAVLVILWIIIALVATALVAEGIVLATGKTLF
jgi:hypothetical protein